MCEKCGSAVPSDVSPARAILAPPPDSVSHTALRPKRPITGLTRNRALIAAAAVTLVAGTAAFLLLNKSNKDDSSLVVLAEGRYGKADLFLLQMGADPKDAEPFAENAEPVYIRTMAAWLGEEPTGQWHGIIPASRGVLVAWSKDDETHVALAEEGSDETVELYRGDGQVQVLFDEQRRLLLIKSIGEEAESCYAGPLSGKPRRIARADSCSFLQSGLVLATDSNDSAPEFDVKESIVTIYDLEGKELAAFATREDAELSPSGSFVTSSDGEEIEVLRTADGDTAASVEGDAAVALGWAAESDTFLFATRDGEDVTLGVIAADGKVKDLLVGSAVTGEIVRDGRTVIAGVRERGTMSLSRVDVSSGEATRLLDEDDIQFEVLEGEESRLLAWKSDGSRFWYGSATSGEMLEVGAIDDFTEMGSVHYDEQTDRVCMRVWLGEDTEGLQLFALNHQNVIRVAAGLYSNFHWPVTFDDTVLVTAEDEGDTVLLELHGNEAQELDRAGRLEVAGIQESAVIYTVVDDRDDMEVRSVGLNGSPPTKTIYEEAGILAFGRSADRTYSSMGDILSDDWNVWA